MEITLLSTFILSILFIKILIKTSEFLGLQDIPNARSAHKKITPRGAGLGFVSAVLISQLVFNFAHFQEYYYIYLSILAVMLTGLYDDRFKISPKLKFLFLFIIATYVTLNGLQITSLGNYLGIDVKLTIWLAVPFTIFAIIGFTNALNLTDGLDGLAGTLALVMMVAFLMVGIKYDDMFLITFSSSFIVAIIGFLYFNWSPAKIFMGDSGSLSLGFVISVLSIKSLEYIAPSAVLFIIGLPLIDTFIVIYRRLQRGQSPFIADKNHIHHFMYKTKLNVQISVLLLIYIQLIFSIIGYQLREENQIISLILFGLLVFVFLNLFDQRLRYRRPHKKSKKNIELKSVEEVS